MRHGGDLGEAIAAAGESSRAWLDLSTGINPHAYPVPPLAPEVWARLPQSAALDNLIGAARAAYGVPPHVAIAAAPGTQALIQLMPRLFRGESAAIVGPTYGEHGAVWEHAARQVAAPDEAGDAAILIVVNPNNPDGRITAPAEVTAAARGRRLTIVDEAFADCAPHASVIPQLGDEPILVLRSFGKMYGLAGLRLGFVLGLKRLVAPVAEALGPWAVSGPALAIGAAALRDEDWRTAMRGRLRAEAEALDALLSRRGLRVVGGSPLFRLVEDERAWALHAALAREAVWTRIFDYRRDWMRIGLPGADHVQRFEAALARALRSL
jgi:cobalamin biosynthetic protein CobC